MEEWQLWGPPKTSFPSLCNPEQLTSHSEGLQFPQLENGGDTIKNSWVQTLMHTYTHTFPTPPQHQPTTKSAFCLQIFLF